MAIVEDPHYNADNFSEEIGVECIEDLIESIVIEAIAVKFLAWFDKYCKDTKTSPAEAFFEFVELYFKFCVTSSIEHICSVLDNQDPKTVEILYQRLISNGRDVIIIMTSNYSDPVDIYSRLLECYTPQ